MVLENYVLSPAWIWALTALIPLFLLYFLKPKPLQQTIPSLMFLLRDKKQKKLRGFLQKFIPNILLLLQVLIILVLAVALMRPYLEVPLAQTAQETIIVLDNSASMHVHEQGQKRYEQAVSEVTNNLGRSNTLILAGVSADIVLEEASAQEVREYLQTWTPTHQPTHLRVALQEALQRANSDTAIVVVSDFIDTEPQSSPQEALSALRSQAGDFQEIQVGTQNTNNIGIIEVRTSDLRTTIAIKNFDTQQRQTTACVAGVCKDFTLQEQETQEWTFKTPQGISEVRLDTNDAFDIDDIVYLSAEEQNTIDVLVVTNQDWNQNPLSQVFEALSETSVLNIQTTINRPPELATVNQDLLIFTGINSQSVVQRTMRDAQERVETNGAATIIMYQQGLFGLPYGELLPVIYQEQGGATPVLNTNNQQQFVGLEYGSTPEHFLVEAQEQTLVLARGAQEQPLIAIKALGAGRTMYYGLPATASFSTNPDYPLFWKNAIDTLLQRQSASQRTRSTATILTTAQPLQTPQGNQESGTVRLSHTGVYRGENSVLVANLNNAQESNIAAQSTANQPTALQLQGQNTAPKEYTRELLLAALLLLFVELAYLKYRGDI